MARRAPRRQRRRPGDGRADAERPGPGLLEDPEGARHGVLGAVGPQRQDGRAVELRLISERCHYALGVPPRVVEHLKKLHLEDVVVLGVAWFRRSDPRLVAVLEDSGRR